MVKRIQGSQMLAQWALPAEAKEPNSSLSLNGVWVAGNAGLGLRPGDLIPSMEGAAIVRGKGVRRCES